MDYVCPTGGETVATNRNGQLTPLTSHASLQLNGGSFAVLCNSHNALCVTPSEFALQQEIKKQKEKQDKIDREAAAERKRREEQYQAQQRAIAEQREQEELKEKRLQEQAEELKKKRDALEAEQRAQEERKKQEQRLQEEEEARLRTTGGLKQEDFNVAVAGESGVGKSTLTNSLQGKAVSDPLAAAVSTGAECTQVTAKYSHPRCEGMAIFDFPGGATQRHPREQYCKRQCLHLFDVILICFTSRWTEVSSDIAVYAHANKIPVLAVFTKAKNEIANEMAANGELPSPATAAVAEQRLRSKLTAELGEKMLELGLPPIPLFLVESYSLIFKSIDGESDDLYDGPRLLTTLAHMAAPRLGLAGDELAKQLAGN